MSADESIVRRAISALHNAYVGGEWAASRPDEVPLAAAREYDEAIVVMDELRRSLSSGPSQSAYVPPREEARAFRRRLTEALQAEAARADIAEPRDFTQYDATVNAVITHGALLGLSTERTLLMLCVRLAAQKREYVEYAKQLVMQLPPQAIIPVPGRQQ